MIELRRITVGDIEQAAEFVIEGIRPELYPLQLSRPNVEAVLRLFTEPSPDRFQLAAFDGERIVGGVAAAVMPMLWFQFCEAQVVMCRSTAPGAGRALLRRLVEWAREDWRIRRVVWPMEFHADPRVAKLAGRLGFANQLTVCSYYKGM